MLQKEDNAIEVASHGDHHDDHDDGNDDVHALETHFTRQLMSMKEWGNYLSSSSKRDEGERDEEKRQENNY